VAVLDAFNGRVLALAGASDKTYNTYNIDNTDNTDNTDNAAGGLLVPFIYLDAFANGFAPASLVWNLGEQASREQLGPVSQRTALANGLSLPASELLQQLGAGQVAGLLRAAGLGEFRRSLSEAEATQLILSDAQIFALELAGAYGTLSTGSFAGQNMDGELQPSALLFVTDSAGRIVLDWSLPQLRAVASPELAYLVTDVLSDASVRPQAQSALLAALDRPAALQPGAAAQWAAGYSPQRAVVVFVEQGSAAAAWAQAFQIAHAGTPVHSWQAPGGLSSVMVCVPSGQLPDGDCPQTRREFFLSGSEPRFADDLYQRLAINLLNGKLATVFTPEEFVQELIFLDVPAGMEAWAQSAGLDLPPDEYDSIPALEDASALRITTPARFAEISGAVTIRAQLPAGITGWDLQIGRGLYPQRWQQVAAGAGSQTAAASWDPAGLSGLWAIQLQAWDAAGNVQRAYSVVQIAP
jgi:membrane peptidoglycan carboxypeptidase